MKNEDNDLGGRMIHACGLFTGGFATAYILFRVFTFC